MNKTLGWVLVYGLIGYGAYYLITKKKRDAKTIAFSGNTTGSIDKLMTFDAAFLSAWAAAVKRKDAQFTYQNKLYVTKGGSAKK